MSLSQIFPFVPLALMAPVLLKVVVEDVTRYLIPHRLIGAVVALYLFYAICGGPVASPFHSLIVAIITLLVGMAFFLMGTMGGGDVKLLAVLMLWAGPEEALPFLLVTSILGGLLTLFVLSRWWALIPAGTPRHHVLARTPVAVGAAELLSVEAGVAARGGTALVRRKALAVPYGVAIAAGGLLLVAERAYQLLSAH